MEKIRDFPFWVLWFGDRGQLEDPGAISKFIDSDLASEGITDLFVFSHGWNNDQKEAREMYERFFGTVDDVLRSGRTLKPGAKIGTAGVFWPSMYWADETNPAGRDAAAAAGAGQPAVSDGDLVRGLKKVYPKSKHATLDELAQLLEDRPDDDDAVMRFHKLMVTLAPTPDVAPTEDDNGEETGLLKREAHEVFRDMDAAAPAPRVGGAAGLLDDLWNGAKNALRQTSYYEMKKRAGQVGNRGLGPVLERLHAAQPSLRIHLIGHSFGARLVSYSLSGLAPTSVEKKSPVKSMLLLQGAFSHFAFADELPHDSSRSGGLKGMPRRVDGPLLVTYSRHDSAVGRLYPAASFAKRDDASASGLPSRWGAMGSSGAQAVDADGVSFGGVGSKYRFQGGKFLNLDGNDLIRVGGGLSGAHSDIVYPEIAWASLAASGVVT